MVGTMGGREHFPEGLAEVYSLAQWSPTKSNWFLSLSGPFRHNPRSLGGLGWGLCWLEVYPSSATITTCAYPELHTGQLWGSGGSKGRCTVPRLQPQLLLAQSCGCRSRQPAQAAPELKCCVPCHMRSHIRLQGSRCVSCHTDHSLLCCSRQPEIHKGLAWLALCLPWRRLWAGVYSWHQQCGSCPCNLCWKKLKPYTLLSQARISFLCMLSRWSQCAYWRKERFRNGDWGFSDILWNLTESMLEKGNA